MHWKRVLLECYASCNLWVFVCTSDAAIHTSPYTSRSTALIQRLFYLFHLSHWGGGTRRKEDMTQFYFRQTKQMEQQRENEMKWEQKKRNGEHHPEWELEVMRANFHTWLYIFWPTRNDHHPSVVQSEYWGNLCSENCLHISFIKPDLLMSGYMIVMSVKVVTVSD